jgi:hypothetical protein
MRGNLKRLGIRPCAPDDNVTATFRSQLMESPATGPPWRWLLLRPHRDVRTILHRRFVQPTTMSSKKEVVLNRPSAYYRREWQRSGIPPSLLDHRGAPMVHIR